MDRTSQLDPDGSGPLTWVNQLSSWGEDAGGELYMVAIGRGAVYQVVVPEPGLALITGVGLLMVAGRRARR